MPTHFVNTFMTSLVNTIVAYGLSCFLLFSITPAHANNDHLKLPKLGGGGASSISPQQEYKLGRTWTRLFRSQAPINSDPIIQEYLESLVQQLAIYSELNDHRLEVLVVNNKALNAFAVPGGVLGIHSGLLLRANDEHELSAVISHELAHLSQRHYARKEDRSSLPTLAGLLGGLILLATTGADIGIAAISTAQALAIDRQLRFSRQYEQEADRVAIRNIAKADMDPNGATRMFEEMLKSARFAGRRPPEFLLSHPVTESRIADAKQRASQYPLRHYPSNENYSLIQARIRLLHAINNKQAIKQFQSELKLENSAANRYALTIAQIADKQWLAAEKTLAPLFKSKKPSILYTLAAAEIETGLTQYDKAIARLTQARQQNPNIYSINMALASSFEQARRFDEAKYQLQHLARRRPEDPSVWYRLAEVQGLSGDILGVHYARSEYFILNGIFDKAMKQLSYGIKLAKSIGNVQLLAIMQKRLVDTKKLQEEAKRL